MSESEFSMLRDDYKQLLTMLMAAEEGRVVNRQAIEDLSNSIADVKHILKEHMEDEEEQIRITAENIKTLSESVGVMQRSVETLQLSLPKAEVCAWAEEKMYIQNKWKERVDGGITKLIQSSIVGGGFVLVMVLVYGTIEYVKKHF